MKKILLSLTVAAFAFAVQADDAKKEKDSKETKDAPACCAAKTGAQTKGTCSSEKGKMACSGGACKDAPSKRALLSPKAAAEVGR